MAMKIIHKREFRKVQDVRLNRNGMRIGKIVSFRKRLYYFTYRTGKHYFIKFQGFGIDRILLRKICIPDGEIDNIFDGIEGIILFYDGIREKRYYLVDPYVWLEEGIQYGTAKEVGNETHSYGEQLILPKAKMELIGCDREDYEVKTCNAHTSQTKLTASRK